MHKIFIAVIIASAMSHCVNAQHQTRLPKTTIAAFSANEFESLKDTFQQSGLAKYLNHKQIRASWSAPLEVATNPILAFLSSGEMAEFRRRQVTFAVVKTASRIHFAVLVDFESDSLAETCFAQLASKLGLVDTTIVGVKKITFSKTQKSAWLQQKDSFLAITDDPELLRILAMEKKESLGNSKKFMSTVTKAQSELTKHQVWFYLEPTAFIERENSESGASGSILWNEGIDALQALGGCAGRLPSDESKMVVAANILATRPFRRGMRLLNLSKAERLVFPKHASGSISTGFICLDIEKIPESFSTIFDATIGAGEDGVFEAVLSDLKTDTNGPKIDVEQEIVRNLVTPAFIASKYNHGKQEVVVAIRIENVERFRNAVVRFYEGDELSSKIDCAFDAWLVQPLDSINSGDVEPYVVGVKDKHLIVAPNLEAINQLQLRKFQQAEFEHSPFRDRFNDHYCFGYQLDLQRLVRIAHQQVANGEKNGLISSVLRTFQLELKVDQLNWPTFEPFESYFKRTLLLAAKETAEGWSIAAESK